MTMVRRPNDDVAIEIGHLFLEVIALRRQSDELITALKEAQIELQAQVTRCECPDGCTCDECPSCVAHRPTVAGASQNP